MPAFPRLRAKRGRSCADGRSAVSPWSSGVSGEEGDEEGRPDGLAAVAAGKAVPIVANGTNRSVSRLPAGAVISVDHASGEAGLEEAFVRGIDPERRDARAGAVPGCRLHQRVGRAIAA